MSFTFLDSRLPKKFWNNVIPEPNSGCWIWLGGVSGKSGKNGEHGGYGRMYIGKIDDVYRTVYTHRLAYETLVAEIPQRLRNRSSMQAA